jgi:hypothetical protein
MENSGGVAMMLLRRRMKKQFVACVQSSAATALRRAGQPGIRKVTRLRHYCVADIILLPALALATKSPLT